MNNVSLITFADNSTVAFAADGSTITVTDASGTAKVYTASAPVVAPSDTEVDITRSDGSVQKFVPAA
jgi:hypothetical protein